MAEYGSDLIVDVLSKYGIEYASCNPGATFRGLHDSVVNYDNENSPELVLCCHEEIAVAIAHGYAKAAGKPMAVFIHSNVGLQHASMAVFNAWCDRVPMLLLCGVGPLDSAERRPWIDWIHTSQNQAGIISDYVKWHDQPHSIEATVESLHRSFKLMNSEPKAPVYLGIDALIQEQELTTEIEIGDIANYAPPLPPQANPDALHTLAALLVKAEFPLILADYLGREPSAVAELRKLAELLSVPVIDCGARFNFPTNHPLSLTGVEKEYLKNCDLILALDVNDLYGALGTSSRSDRSYKSCVNKDVKVVTVSLAEYLVGSWAADYQKLYPVTMSIAADSKVVLPELSKQCAELITDSEKYNNRRKIVAEKHLQLRKEWQEIAKTSRNSVPLAVPTVVDEIWEVIKAEEWVLTNEGSYAIGKWLKKLWDFTKSEQYMGNNGGAGLGYGMGASIGVALAHKNGDKICINIQADGDLLFTPSAFWTSNHYQVPLLTIVMNNYSYNNTRLHAVDVANNRGREAANADIGTSLDGPRVDFPKMAESFGIHSFPTIDNLAEIGPILTEAIRFIKEKRQPVLIDIAIEK